MERGEITSTIDLKPWGQHGPATQHFHTLPAYSSQHPPISSNFLSQHVPSHFITPGPNCLCDTAVKVFSKSMGWKAQQGTKRHPSASRKVNPKPVVVQDWRRVTVVVNPEYSQQQQLWTRIQIRTVPPKISPSVLLNTHRSKPGLFQGSIQLRINPLSDQLSNSTTGGKNALHNGCSRSCPAHDFVQFLDALVLSHTMYSFLAKQWQWPRWPTGWDPQFGLGHWLLQPYSWRVNCKHSNPVGSMHLRSIRFNFPQVCCTGMKSLPLTQNWLRDTKSRSPAISVYSALNHLESSLQVLAERKHIFLNSFDILMAGNHAQSFDDMS